MMHAVLVVRCDPCRHRRCRSSSSPKKDLLEPPHSRAMTALPERVITRPKQAVANSLFVTLRVVAAAAANCVGAFMDRVHRPIWSCIVTHA